MKKVEHYICEICGTEYNDKSKAMECEKHHKKIIKVSPEKYRPKGMNLGGYPEILAVEFDDGSLAKYKRG